MRPAFTPVPSIQTDSSGTGWVVSAHDDTSGPGNTLTVFPVTNNNGSAAMGAGTSVAVPSFSVPASVPQKGTKITLDSLDGRLEHAVSAIDPGHGGAMALWTAHAVFGGAGSEERWYEIDPAAASILQSGKATSSSLYVWNGAVSPDRASSGSTGTFGDSMVMGFNTSSANTYSAIQMVSARAGQPESAFVPVQQSNGYNADFTCSSTAACRWGDYSGATPDPSPPASGAHGQVWLSNQWNLPATNGSATVWQTWNWQASP